MNTEENLPPQVEYWLSPDARHDCYFNVGSESGPVERIGTFKAFLLGYSEPLRAMLQDSELAEQGDVTIIDIQPETFRVFLKCLYTSLNDSIIKNLSIQTSCELLYIADKYLVLKLKDKLIDQCLNTLSPEISCIFIAISSKVFMQESCLKMAFSKIVQTQIRNIVSSEQFLQIPNDSLLWILELDPLDIDEMSLWEAVLKWAKNKTKSNNGSVIRKCILKQLKFIRFCSMSLKDFVEKVVPENVLFSKEVNQVCKYHGTNAEPNMTYICNTVTRRHSPSDISLEPITPVVTTFAWHVSDILNFTRTRTSSNFEFLNFDWHILLKRNDNVFGLFLECVGSTQVRSWNCRVSGTLTLLNHRTSNISRSFSNYRYCSGRSSWGFYKFPLWSEVVDPSNNYVHNNSIIVLVTVESAEQ